MTARTHLPPGFRFHPTDVELVCYYLKRKVIGKPFHYDAITEVELYKFAPWDLPEKSQLYSKDLEWYFLCPRDKKYPSGCRTNRTTEIGYWKATGKDRSIEYDSRTIGMKKTLIFHVGKPPKGERTDWVMYEYRLEDKEVAEAGFSQDAYVLCKIFQKSGLGPKIGEQYGAPFNEADWEDNTNAIVSLPFPSCSTSNIIRDQAISASVFQQSNTSDVEDPSDPDLSGLDGIAMDDLEKMFASPAENSEKMSDASLSCENNTEVSAIGFEPVCNELEGPSSQTFIPGNNNSVDIPNGFPSNSILSELFNDQYLELNDLSFPGYSDTCISLMQDCLLEQHPFVESACLNYLNNDIVTSSVDATFIGNSSCGDFEANLDASSSFLQIETSGLVPPEDFTYDFWNY